MTGILGKRKLLVAIVLFVLFFVVIGSLQAIGKSKQTDTYNLMQGSIEQVVTASGNISSAGTLDVYSTVNGVVTDILIQNGQTVTAETPLFVVTSTASPQEKAAAKASYLEAVDAYNKAEQNKLLYQAQLEQARQAIIDTTIELEDFRDLIDQPQLDQDSIHSQDWSKRKLFENAEKKYVDATQTLSAKAQSITAKKTAYEATLDQTITSAVAGTIANINPELGDEVYIVSSLKAEPVLTISNFDTYTVKVNVSENDIYKIQLGQQASVAIKSFPDNDLTGTVSKVDTIGEVTNGLVTYEVTIDLFGIDMRMRAGMTAEVDIVTDSYENSLLIPNEAIAENENGKIAYIQSATATGYSVQPIQIGIKDDTHSQVLSGLTGNEVLLDPLDITKSESQ